MVTELAKRLTEAWHDFTTAKDSRVRDACGQEVWLALTRQARGTPQERCALIAKQLMQEVDSESLRAILPLVTEAVYAWYESDFGESARLFKRLETTLQQRGRKLRPVCPDCCRIVRVHALCWAAAASARQGQPKDSRQDLRAAFRLLPGKNKPRLLNAEGWYWAESGRVSFLERNLRGAEDGYVRAYECFEATHNEYALAEIDCAQARLLTHQGRYALALERITSAQRWRDHDNPLERAKMCFYTGRIFRYEHKHVEALEQFQSGLRYVHEVKNAHWEANLHDALGDVCLLLGKLNEASHEYGLYGKRCNKKDAAQRRVKYQQAKLVFQQAIIEQPGPARQQMLNEVRRACKELSRGPDSEMLPSKAQLLESQALIAQQDYAAASKASENAAQGFREDGAWWYAAEAMLLTGEAYLAAGKLAAAAQVFLAGLQSTVDGLQRQRFLAEIHRKSSSLDPQEVCACIAELLKQNEELANARDAYRRTEDGLRSLLVSIRRPLRIGIGSVAHLQRQVENLVAKFPDDRRIASAREEVRAHSELLNCQGQLAECWQTRLSTPRWLSFAEIVDDPKLRISAAQAARLQKRHGLGVFTDPQLVAGALQDLAEVMRRWVGTFRTTCACDNSGWHLGLCLRGTPRRWEATNGKLAGLVHQEAPSLTALKSCCLQPRDWARLNWAAIRLRSIGGDLRLRAERRSGNRPHQECCLEVEIPCDQVPLWHADPNSNTFKER